MTITPINAIRRAYNNAAESMPLADTEDVLAAVAEQFGLSVEAVAEALEREEPEHA